MGFLRGGKGHQAEPGDGPELKPYRFWQVFARSLFYLRMRFPTGSHRVYAVNVDYFDGESKSDLYVDGRHYARSHLPAVFPIPGGHIEVATSFYGLRRMHFVSDQGREQVLVPDAKSAEGIRARADRRFPRSSKLLGVMAVVTLLAVLPLGLVQLVEMITHLEPVRQHVGSFSSPVTLPAWANTTATVAGLLAGMERALMLRNHRLIDMEAGVFDV